MGWGGWTSLPAHESPPPIALTNWVGSLVSPGMSLAPLHWPVTSRHVTLHHLRLGAVLRLIFILIVIVDCNELVTLSCHDRS